MPTKNKKQKIDFQKTIDWKEVTKFLSALFFCLNILKTSKKELAVEAATSRAASGGEEGELFSLPVGKKRGDLTRLKIGRDHVCPSFFGHLFWSVNNIFEIAKNGTNFELSKKGEAKGEEKEQEAEVKIWIPRKEIHFQKKN